MYKLEGNKSYIYFDKNISDFSNIATGLIIQAIGAGLKIAYINSNSQINRLTNFIENLSLSYNFKKNLQNFHLDIYSPLPNQKVAKTIIPQVEFGNITEDMFWNSLNSYNLLIFDNIDFEILNKIKLISILKNKMPYTQITVTTSDKKDFQEMKENFNTSITINYLQNQNLIAKKGIMNIIGKEEGKSLYAFGYLIKQFILKKDVKLIYFDKGDDIYPDVRFFTELKKWSIKNNIYGKFDFVKTGIKRIYHNHFRESNDINDKKEALDALMLLKTSLKKQSPVAADELNTIISKKILDENEIIPTLEDIKQELIITGEESTKKILDLSETIIQFTKTEN